MSKSAYVPGWNMYTPGGQPDEHDHQAELEQLEVEDIMRGEEMVEEDRLEGEAERQIAHRRCSIDPAGSAGHASYSGGPWQVATEFINKELDQHVNDEIDREQFDIHFMTTASEGGDIINDEVEYDDDDDDGYYEPDDISDILNGITQPPLMQLPPEVKMKGGLNTSEEVIMQQVASNIRRGHPQVQIYHPNGNTAVIVGSGASLKQEDQLNELRDALWGGGKLVALNGAARWCVERNLKPSAVVVLDARESSAEFVRDAIPGCKYLLASQCHPKAFDYCSDRDVTIWHACSAGQPEVDLLEAYYFKHIHPISMGTTVGTRAISLLRMLGYYRMHVFGLDSCWINGEHHAMPQAMNDKDKNIDVWLRPGEGREHMAQKFQCAPWHIKQAEDFLELIKERGHLFQLNVHGPGLIASILRTGAAIETE